MSYTRKHNVRTVFFVCLGLFIQSCLATAVLPAGGRRALSTAVNRRELVAPRGGGSKVFDIRDFGAKGDGVTNNFKAFLKVWMAVCTSRQPAKLLVPQGKFLVGPVIFAGPCASPVTVEVQGTIVATSSMFEYLKPEWFLFEYIDNLVVTGSGTFDGNGAASWKRNECDNNHHCRLPPSSLKIRRSNNVVVENIKSINAKAFHMFIVNSKNVKVNGITITAPEDSPNTDGIHMSNSHLVNITDSVIGTGDDCISVGHGSTSISVERVVCGPGHGISIGSLGKYDGEKDVSDVFVNNCTLRGTDNGARIKTWKSSPPSQAHHITFQDIIMENVKRPILIDQNYGNNKKNAPSRVKISEVLFKNIRGTSASENVVQLNCSKVVPCQGVKVVDINLSYNGGRSGGGSSKAGKPKPKRSGLVETMCSNVNAIFHGKITLPICK